MSKTIIKKFILIILLMLIVLYILFFIKSGKENQVMGLWDVDGNTQYEFAKNGSGKIIVPLKEIKFTYVIRNNVLSIDFEDEKSIDTEYEFKITNNVLELKDLKQKDVKLKLKKIK